MSQNLSSAAVVIGALRVKGSVASQIISWISTYDYLEQNAHAD